jgi:uncharacterized protein YabE (DUF348 family)
MKQVKWIVLAALLVLCGCQTGKFPVTVFADGQIYNLSTTLRAPLDLLVEAGLTLGANDRLLYLGAPVQPDADLPKANAYTLIVRRAVTLTVVIPAGTQTIQSSAPTVGQALAEAGFTLYAADRLDPPAGTPLNGPLTVTYQPSRELTITVDGTRLQVRSAAPTVGEALADAGIPLVGLDYSKPSENEALPSNGQVRVVRVVESVTLTQQAIPFDTRTELSADLELDQQALLQGGEPGLAVARLRTRSEDGQQVSQTSEAASIVRPPQDRILGIGSKIVIRTATVDGVTIEYWRALNLYATYFVPCDAITKVCNYGTSSGKPVQKGVVAFVYPWYLLFGGQPLYVPGYGFASVEDTNGAYTTIYGTHWIDLGYSQTDNVDWANHYVTVYFLTPVPANVADTYLLP